MILWALALLIFVSNLGFSIVIPILPEMLKRVAPDIGATELLVADGVFYGGFNLAKILFQVPAGSVSDRIGDRRVVITSAILYALSLVLLIHARDFTGLYVARIIEGIATGVCYPAVISLVMRHSPPERLNRNMKWPVFAGGAGFVAGPPLCSLVVESTTLGLPRDVMRPLWWMLWFTIAGGGLSLLAFVLLPDMPRLARSPVPSAEVEALAASEGIIGTTPLPHASDEQAQRGFVATVSAELKILARFSVSLPLYLFVAPMLVDKTLVVAMLAVLPIHGDALGMSKDTPAVLLGVFGVSFAVCTLVAGWLSDRVPLRRLVFGTVIGMAGAVGALALARDSFSFVPFYCVYCVFASVLMTASMNLVMKLYHTKEGHGRVAGIVLSVTDLGTIVGPVVYNWIYSVRSIGPTLSFAAMGATGALATFAFWRSAGREQDLPQVESR